MKKLAALVFLVLMGCGKSAPKGEGPPASAAPDVRVPSQAQSEVTSDTQIPADGSTPAHIYFVLRTEDRRPIAGVAVEVGMTGSGNMLTKCPRTDSEGRTTCLVYSTWAEEKTVEINFHHKWWTTVIFVEPPFNASVTGIVSSGTRVTTNQGHRITSASGIIESPIQLFDAQGVLRLRSSVQGALVELP